MIVCEHCLTVEDLYVCHYERAIVYCKEGAAEAIGGCDGAEVCLGEDDGTMRYGWTRAPFASRTFGWRRYSVAGPTNNSARWRSACLFADVDDEDVEREYDDMHGT